MHADASDWTTTHSSTIYAPFPSANREFIFVLIAEAGCGDPVILLHGYPQSGEVWRFVAPELAKTHRVIIPDLRGMGLSDAAKDGYDLNNVAEDIHQLVLSMGISKVKVVGHDWGAAVGAVYALRYRDEVSRLGFLESALAGAGFEDLWNFSKPNGVFAFIPFLLMGEADAKEDTTAALLQGRESIFLHHLWETFTGDKEAAPFAGWSPYVAAMSRPGIAISSSSYLSLPRTSFIRVWLAMESLGARSKEVWHETILMAAFSDTNRAIERGSALEGGEVLCC
jgi:pimeloyl-ACP methyl ester carboxylesterase